MLKRNVLMIILLSLIVVSCELFITGGMYDVVDNKFLVNSLDGKWLITEEETISDGEVISKTLYEKDLIAEYYETAEKDLDPDITVKIANPFDFDDNSLFNIYIEFNKDNNLLKYIMVLLPPGIDILQDINLSDGAIETEFSNVYYISDNDIYIKDKYIQEIYNRESNSYKKYSILSKTNNSEMILKRYFFDTNDYQKIYLRKVVNSDN